MNVIKSIEVELTDEELQELAEGRGLQVPLDDDQLLVLQPPRERMAREGSDE